MFPSPTSTDEYELRNQRISTRLFIILLIVILAILLFYTSLAIITKTITVKTPTIHQYLQLYARYPHTLTCACTKISIKYENIVNVKYSFHQICTSDFVSDDWTNYLDFSHKNIIVWAIDFRWTSPYQFRALRVLCQLINRSISNDLDRFYSNEYLSAFVTPSKLFRSQVQASVDQFKSSTKNNILLSFSMIRDTTQANALYTAQLTNFNLQLLNDAKESIVSYGILYHGCRCDFSAKCIVTSAMYDFNTDTNQFIVPGFYVGCYVIESLLQSTLECFYDQTCINILQSYCTSSTQINVTALNPSLSSQYFVNSTIQDLLNNLMVEQWILSEKYNSYYNACQPSECIYTYTTRSDIIYIVTTLAGFLGGLITVLKLVVPLLVKFIRRCFKSPRVKTGKTQ